MCAESCCGIHGICFDGGLSACYTPGFASFSSFFFRSYGAEGNGMYGIRDDDELISAAVTENGHLQVSGGMLTGFDVFSSI
jgi:hypothetical protein